MSSPVLTVRTINSGPFVPLLILGRNLIVYTCPSYTAYLQKIPRLTARNRRSQTQKSISRCVLVAKLHHALHCLSPGHLLNGVVAAPPPPPPRLSGTPQCQTISFPSILMNDPSSLANNTSHLCPFVSAQYV